MTKDGNESVDLLLTLSHKEIEPILKHMKSLVGLVSPISEFTHTKNDVNLNSFHI